jgi:hypothetical protein
MIWENVKKLPQWIGESDKVLDVGGWHSPLNRANAIVDIMPYETRNRAGAIATDVWPEERFGANTFIQLDLCQSEPWPFADKEFDFVLCSHTLEDLRDPIGVCRELVRVAKSGYIEVPSRLTESSRGVERPFYCGYYHHRWLCEVEGTKISFMFKPAMLHAYRKFHFRKPWNKKVNPQLEAVGFYWQGAFEFEERIIIDRDEVQQDLVQFKQKFIDRGDLFVPKYNWRGQRL